MKAGEVQWIKLTTDMFDNRKIKHLRRLPDGNSVVLIWVMLLTMAGRCNASGMIFLTENIPYTTALLADELGFPETTVQMALEAFAQLDMIIMNDNYFTIAGWEEYQNVEGLEKVREQSRKRVAKYRQKKLLEAANQDGNVSCNVTVTQCNALDKEEDKDIDKEEEKDKEKEIEKERRERTNYQKIADLYNQLCPSLPKITSLSESRKKAIKARLNTYSVDDFIRLFEKAEASKFLTGGNSRNWSANFDWLIKDANFAKVLDGNYDSFSSGAAVNSAAQELNDYYSMVADWAQS